MSEETVRALDSSDPDTLQAAFLELAQIGDDAAVMALDRRIRRGLPPAAILPAVETLGLMARPSAAPVLVEVLAPHRRGDVRAAAIRALTTCRGRGAVAAVRARMGDPVSEVRSAAAVALGELRDVDSIPLLFRALDRHLYEAASSLGRLVRGESIARLVGYVGRLPFDVMGPALSELLARSDVSESRKLDVVARLQDLGTAEAKFFLEDLAASIPDGGPDARVRQAALDASMRIVE